MEIRNQKEKKEKKKNRNRNGETFWNLIHKIQKLTVSM